MTSLEGKFTTSRGYKLAFVERGKLESHPAEKDLW